MPWQSAVISAWPTSLTRPRLQLLAGAPPTRPRALGEGFGLSNCWRRRPDAYEINGRCSFHAARSSGWSS